MMTTAIEAIAQLKAEYHKQRADKAAELANKVATNTDMMRVGILVAIRDNPKVSILEPFVKVADCTADADGDMPMACTIEAMIPKHAPIYLSMHRGYGQADEAPIWELGNIQMPKIELSVWHPSRYYATEFFRGYGWHLGEVLALAEERYVEYFNSLEKGEVPDSSQAPPMRAPIVLTPAEEAVVIAMRDLFRELWPE